MMLNLLDKPAQIFKFNAAFYIPKNKRSDVTPSFVICKKMHIRLLSQIEQAGFHTIKSVETTTAKLFSLC